MTWNKVNNNSYTLQVGDRYFAASFFPGFGWSCLETTKQGNVILNLGRKYGNDRPKTLRECKNLVAKEL